MREAEMRERAQRLGWRPGLSLGRCGAAAALLAVAAVAGGAGGCGGQVAASDVGPSGDGGAPGDGAQLDQAEGGSADTEADLGPDVGPPSQAVCEVLFGAPNDKTGLTAEQCQPRCDCEGKRFQPPAYTADDVAALRAMKLLDVEPPLAPLDGDPYAASGAPARRPDAPSGAVCAVGVEPDGQGYHLKTFASWGEAEVAEGPGGGRWQVSHAGACGLCSPLADLAVYMGQPDLTDPVRQCGLDHLLDQDPAAHIQCLMDLGFDEACATIWYYNTKFTQKECGSVCMSLLSAPYHEPDGSLNACLQCDEDKSGPVFKAVAGRTRRNTGLPSSMCRPCSSVVPVVHRYR